MSMLSALFSTVFLHYGKYDFDGLSFTRRLQRKSAVKALERWCSVLTQMMFCFFRNWTYFAFLFLYFILSSFHWFLKFLTYFSSILSLFFFLNIFRRISLLKTFLCFFFLNSLHLSLSLYIFIYLPSLYLSFFQISLNYFYVFLR